MTPLEDERKGRSYLTHVQRKLINLEASRRAAKISKPAKWNGTSRKAGPLFLNSGQDALMHVNAVIEIGPIRAKARKQRRQNIDERNAAKKHLQRLYTNQYSNPFSWKSVSDIIDKLSKELGTYRLKAR
jgi:hypothetical protein